MHINNLEINREVVASTCHIADATRGFLNDQTNSLVVYEYEYGWRVVIGDEVDAQILYVKERGHPELADLMAIAKENNCDWLVLDSDGPEYDELPVFEWES